MVLTSTQFPALGFFAWSSLGGKSWLDRWLDRRTSGGTPAAPRLSPGTWQGYPGSFTQYSPFFEQKQTRLTRLVYSLSKFLSRLESSRSSRSTRSEHTPPARRTRAYTRRVYARLPPHTHAYSERLDRPDRPVVFTSPLWLEQPGW
jgi:hypothetical protein